MAVFGSVGLLLPIYALTRALFDRRIACLAAALAVLLPRTAELGHDTLSDSLGLMCTFLAFGWERSLCAGAIGDSRSGRDWPPGLGYLARPEVILVPFAIGLTWLTGLVRDSRCTVVTCGPALRSCSWPDGRDRVLCRGEG